ncbi:MAG: hypothetical protein GX613_11025 [Chloroflexi bacterium]|jgi:hypothetical protein|nr:hypothetical protein [Chloroflexota bacterium]
MAGSGSGSGRGPWIAVVIGLAIGVGLGLFYTWELDPVIERNTAPWQLSPAAREDYVIAVAMSYAHTGDLTRAFDRLRAVAPDRNVWQMVADIACQRHRTIQIATNSDILVMRALEQLYRPQGAQGCADGQYPTPAPVVFNTPTPMPTLAVSPASVATKTPVTELAPLTATPEPLPTNPPTSDRFIIARVESFCDPDLDGIIEVRVFDMSGQGVRGMPVQFTWSGGQRDQAFTGLKPGREPGYADFQMEPDRAYQVSVPGLVSDPRSLEAVPCQVQAGSETVTRTTSYRINFQQQAN